MGSNKNIQRIISLNHKSPSFSKKFPIIIALGLAKKMSSVTILLSEKKQRVGDAAAGTVVISVKKKHKITSTILEEITDNYEPTFTNVTQLRDKDVRTIKEAFIIAKKNNDFKTLTLLKTKICEVLQIETELYDKEFIDTILKDYNYYTQNM